MYNMLYTVKLCHVLYCKITVVRIRNIYYRTQSDMACTCTDLIIVFLFVQPELKII